MSHMRSGVNSTTELCAGKLLSQSRNEFEDVKIKRFVYRRIGLTDVIKQIFGIILGIIEDFFLLMPKLKLEFCEFLIKKALSETK